jgi:hypothetical protein
MKCSKSNNRFPFVLETDPNKPKWNYHGDVIGCGLLLDSENELSIIVTLNGILRGLFMLGNPLNVGIIGRAAM